MSKIIGFLLLFFKLLKQTGNLFLKKLLNLVYITAESEKPIE